MFALKHARQKSYTVDVFRVKVEIVSETPLTFERRRKNVKVKVLFVIILNPFIYIARTLCELMKLQADTQS